MKRFLLKLLSLALLLAALAALLAPTALRQYRLWRDDRLTGAYLEAVREMDPEALAALASGESPSGSGLSDPFGREGGGLLPDAAGSDVIAVLEIPKLGETLPVFRDADDAAMALGAGRVEGSGYPGTEASCALAALRGRFGEGPFAGLDRLIPGDRFTLRVAGDALAYEVAQVSEAAGSLAVWPEGEKDACLLATTARGPGDGRLLVLGRRVESGAAAPADDTQVLALWPAGLALAAPLAAAGFILLAAVEGLRHSARRRRLKRVKL